MTRRILVVANRTAATHRLLDELRRRGPAEFALLVPPTRKPDWTPETARDLIARQTRARVTLVDDTAGPYDEAIVSVRAGRLARRRLRRSLGAPVTEVAPRKPRISVRESAEMAITADASLTANMPRDRWDDR